MGALHKGADAVGTVSVKSLGGGKSKLLKYLGTAKVTSSMYTGIDVSHLVNAAGIEPVLGDLILGFYGDVTSVGFLDRSNQKQWYAYPLSRGGGLYAYPAVIGPSNTGVTIDVYYVRLTDAD